MTPEQKFDTIFTGHAQSAAAYLGDLVRISILFNNPEEAAARARLAVKYAREALRQEST